MPSLTALTLTCVTKEPLSNFLQFISRASFPALIVLVLDLPFLGPAPQGTTPCATLQPLFKHIGPRLLSLGLRAPYARKEARLLIPLLKKVQKINLLMGTIPPNLGKLLPASVAELHIGVDLQFGSQPQALVECLDNVLATRNKKNSLAIIRLASSTPEPFKWCSLGTINPVLAGTLMLRSVWLLAKGIQLQDDSGKWIGQLG
ncbi:hypothetical protein CALVIDRAFT_136451 [Calocera viscosa TUFC12733]|uniref:Uncharacterized protein n=1 Tax=Calocera viscosa (strain TUFC12733) TaxID=1330018 RepID=A0A167LYJ1_CALVF|nr:hypothetical protein CALVIDRAFT_136451 [Calocera viscosa TUFC12733]